MFDITNIEITKTNAEHGAVNMSAKCTLVANDTKRKLTTSLRVTAEQIRGGVVPEESIVSKLAKLAYKKAQEA